MEKATVYFTNELTPEAVVKMYRQLGVDLPGKVAVKVHSGEDGNQNYLRPEFMKPVIDAVNGTVVECNTAYGGARNETPKHIELMKKHHWSDLFDVDIMDAEGPDVQWPVENGKVLKVNYLGKNIENYDSMLVLIHFKGHPMGGYGGALKQLSIGCASSAGKTYIHTGGKVTDQNILWENTAEQDTFLEAMADAASTVAKHFAGKIAYVAVMKNLSVDCDCCAVAEDPEHIPALFREHRLDTVHFLAPCRPMMEMIENQVYLAAEEPVAVIGRSAELLARCADMHYAAVALHIRLQTAAAYEMLGKRSEARILVEEAIRDALPDGLVMPFCENYRYIAAILDGERSRCAADTKAFLDKARAIHDHRRQEPMIKEALPDAFAVLTNREREIVRMIGARLSNREIAERLYLTEGTVKQYGNAIYTKLGLTGNTKRRTLIAMLGEAKNGK